MRLQVVEVKAVLEMLLELNIDNRKETNYNSANC
jgi:hypothetical protein